MYVCLCLGVTERDIEEAVEEGACSVAEVMRCTGAGTRCGSCQPAIVALIKPAEVIASTHRHFIRIEDLVPVPTPA